MLKVTARTVGLVINAPDVFDRADFMSWLNASGTATWHNKGKEKAGEYSDVFVLVDSNYEGDSSDMPEDIWNAICSTVYKELCGNVTELPAGATSPVVVRLTNLAE